MRWFKNYIGTAQVHIFCCHGSAMAGARYATQSKEIPSQEAEVWAKLNAGGCATQTAG